MWQGERCDGSNHGFCICGISACIVDLNADQPDVISAAEGILYAALVDLICAETDAAFDAIWADAIQRLTEPGEPEVFRAYQAKWNAAAEVIVPLVIVPLVM